MYRDPESPRTAAQLRRDAMLARVTRARWATAAGAGALTAAFTAFVGMVAPGRSSAKPSERSTTTTATARRASSAMPPAANAAQLGLAPPGGAPQAPPTTPTPQPQTQAAPAPAPVSGGS